MRNAVLARLDGLDVCGAGLAGGYRHRHPGCRRSGRSSTSNFFYTGRTSRYSCDGLRDKVRAMLLDLGARRDIRT